MAAIEAHNTQLGVLPLQVHPAHDRLQHHKPTDTTQDRTGYGVKPCTGFWKTNWTSLRVHTLKRYTNCSLWYEYTDI